MNLGRIALLMIGILAVAGCASPGDQRPTAVLETSNGTVEIELYSDLAPETVQNFGELAEEGYYDDQRFHRVIRGFMIQAGDPLSKDEDRRDDWGGGGPGYTIPDEFACQDGTIVNEHPGGPPAQPDSPPADQCDDHGGFHEDARIDEAGVLAMANTGYPRTGGSQFFITLGQADYLTGFHTVFGTVVEGMSVVEEIGGVETECTAQGYPPGSGRGGCEDIPEHDVIIQSVTIEGELPGVDVDRQER